MGKRGVKPIAADVHMVRGTYRSDKHGNLFAQRSLDVIPEPPDILDDNGKKKWFSFLSYAIQIKGYLAPTELGLVEMMCYNWQKWIDAEMHLIKEGEMVTGKYGPVVSPYLAISQRCLDNYFKLMKEFGMTPTTRTGIKLLDQKKGNDFDDIEP